MLKEYIDWTDTVAQYPITSESFYLVLGMVDEYGELQEKIYSNQSKHNFEEIVKECGDYLWYMARYGSKVLKLNVQDASLRLADQCRNDVKSGDMNFQADEGVKGVIYIGQLCGFEKKKIRDWDTWSVQKRIDKSMAAIESWENAMKSFLYCLQFFEISMQTVISMNKEKLSKRLDEGKIKGDGDNR